MNKLRRPKFGVNKIIDLFQKYQYQVKTGDILVGEVVGIERHRIILNIGLTQVGFLPKEEIPITLALKRNQKLKVRELGEILIISYTPETGQIILSLRRLYYLRVWKRFKQLDYPNLILSTKFIEKFWNGKLVHFDGLEIFIPNRHLSKYYRKKKFISNFLFLKILEVEDQTHRIIGSFKLTIMKNQSSCIKVGLKQKGVITTIRSFGIFINILGIKCLVHISEVPKNKKIQLKALYKPGYRVDVKVIYIDARAGKIALSMKS